MRCKSSYPNKWFYANSLHFETDHSILSTFIQMLYLYNQTIVCIQSSLIVCYSFQYFQCFMRFFGTRMNNVINKVVHYVHICLMQQTKLEEKFVVRTLTIVGQRYGVDGTNHRQSGEQWSRGVADCRRGDRQIGRRVGNGLTDRCVHLMYRFLSFFTENILSRVSISYTM